MANSGVNNLYTGVDDHEGHSQLQPQDYPESPISRRRKKKEDYKDSWNETMNSFISYDLELAANPQKLKCRN